MVTLYFLITSALTEYVDGHHCEESDNECQELDNLRLDLLRPLALHNLKDHDVDDASGRDCCE